MCAMVKCQIFFVIFQPVNFTFAVFLKFFVFRINSIIHNAARHIGKILLVGINIVPCRKCSNCLCPPVISIWFAFIMVIILFILFSCLPWILICSIFHHHRNFRRTVEHIFFFHQNFSLLFQIRIRGVLHQDFNHVHAPAHISNQRSIYLCKCFPLFLAAVFYQINNQQIFVVQQAGIFIIRNGTYRRLINRIPIGTFFHCAWLFHILTILRLFSILILVLFLALVTFICLHFFLFLFPFFQLSFFPSLYLLLL